MSFIAPPAQRGDPVLWYTDANPSQLPDVGFIVHVDGRVTDVVTMNRNGTLLFHQEVHHMTDPLVQENKNIRSNGGWKLNPRFADASDVHSILRAYEDRTDTALAALDRRLAKIEGDLGIDSVRPHEARGQVVAPVIAAADAGLKDVTFGQPEGKTTEEVNFGAAAESNGTKRKK